MYVFNVKSTQNLNVINSDKDKKGIKKAVTRSVSVHVIKTVISLSSLPDGLRMKEPVDVVMSISDPGTLQL